MFRTKVVSRFLDLLSFDFIYSVFGHLSLYIFAFLFAFLAMLVKNLNELVNVRLSGFDLISLELSLQPLRLVLFFRIHFGFFK